MKIIILIIVIIVTVAAGWWFIYKQGLLTNPDKTTYHEGQTVKFRIDGDLIITRAGNMSAPRLLPYYIKDSENQKLTLEHWYTWSCPDIVRCEKGKTVKEKRTEGCVGDVFIGDKEEVHKIYTWDQKAYYEVEEKCGSKTIKREELMQVPKGKYKIFAGALNGQQNVLIKEFTIK